MKRFITIGCCLFILCSFYSSKTLNYQAGEFLQYRIHYGLLNAGFASLEVKNSNYDGRHHHHLIAKGSSSGAVSVSYKVHDRYDTFIDLASNQPSKLVSNTSEGGYTLDQTLLIDHNKKTANLIDKKK